MWCNKHNREMIPSKFPDKKTGEKKMWCPDCYKEWKESKKQSLPIAQNGNQMLIEEIVAFRKEFNDRFDAMAEYIAKMAGELKDRLDDVYRNTEKND